MTGILKNLVNALFERKALKNEENLKLWVSCILINGTFLKPSKKIAFTKSFKVW